MIGANNLQNLALPDNAEIDTDNAQPGPKNNQYGYKAKISTVDAIVKKNRSISRAKARHAHLLLMDLPKAFGAVDRTLLWETLEKKGRLIDIVLRIQRGRKHTQLMGKTQGQYGELVDSNWGRGGRPRISIGRHALHHLHRRYDGRLYIA